ncbi:uncharacterized protein LOC135845402 isoform X1 [Planococcus citri]|uniref:uncharacterized protein LOC135845402 isoform X1 n=1 Tax=Planococcus citri TaxID=170843 RepID=UPI0031F80B99
MPKVNNPSVAKSLVLYEDPATLQQLSAVIVSAELWRTQIVSDEAVVRPLKKALPSVTTCIPGVKTKYKEIIDKYVQPVRQSLTDWLPLHFPRAFLAHEYEYNVLKKYFDLISWQSDGSIHYERTAKAFIECQRPELSIMCKYKLACMYCFEEDIQELYPKLPKIYHELKTVFYISNKFLRYWDCRMANSQLQTGGSMEIELFKKLNPKTWSAWLYCWTRLSNKAHKIEQIVDLMEIKYSRSLHPYVRFLLPMLNNSQLMTVLKRCGKHLFSILARTPDSVKFALQTWHYLKDFVPGSIYVKIFENILTSDLDLNAIQAVSATETFKSSYFLNLDNLANVNVSSLLYEIWLDSPDRLKNHLIVENSAKDTILEMLTDMDNMFTIGTTSRDLRLMLDLLSRRSYLENGPFWRKNWDHVIKGAKLTDVDEAMKLCFKNDKEIAKFKQTQMISQSKISFYCNALAYQGCFDMLNDYFTFCTSDRTVLAELKRNIVRDNKTMIKFLLSCCHDADKMRAFDDFISDLYQTPESRQKLKYQMITDVSSFECLLHWIPYGALNQIKKLVCLFLTSETQVQIVKENLLERCRSVLSKGGFSSFNQRNWNEFLLWCLNDDQKQLAMFKQSLPVKDIFRAVFLKCVKKIDSCLSDVVFSRLDCIDVIDKLGKKRSSGDSKKKQSADDSKEEQSADDSNKDRATDADTDVARQAADDDLEKDWSEIILDKYGFVDDVIDDFQKLGNFLLWYFNDKSKADEFKATRFKKRNVVRKVSDFKNDGLMLVVLHWVFNRNLAQIDAFEVPV